MSQTEHLTQALAFHGGEPVRQRMLPYGRQTIEEEDLAAVAEVLRSDWLTTGPRVEDFEEAFAAFCGAREAVAVSNGTASLHAAMHAADLREGDEVIVPPMTFAASSNAAVYVGATPVFADVEADTLLIDPDAVEAKVTDRTRAVVAVDYAGHPCNYDRLRGICDRHGLALIADACHAPGATYRGRSVGTLADISTFSLHPVKHFTTGEGGLITTDDPEMAARMRRFRNHGITSDQRQREARGSWFYEMVELGYNYRITDFQCALGISQLRRLPGWIERRREIARHYNAAFAAIPAVTPLAVRSEVKPAYHLYVVRFDMDAVAISKADLFAALRAEGIGVNVHYIPIHLHPYYRERFGTGPGLCPVAEQAYEEIITLPVFAGMTDKDRDDVVAAVRKVTSGILQ
jgi:perosamine synthetase